MNKMNTYQVITRDSEIHSCFWVALVARYAQSLQTIKIETDENGEYLYTRMTFLENKYSETFRSAAEMVNHPFDGWTYGNEV